MPTKIVRTVIGGKVIETPVEVAEAETKETKETPKAKRGRPKKTFDKAPKNDKQVFQTVNVKKKGR